MTTNLVLHDPNEEIVESDELIKVLDKGYIRLEDKMGSDLKVVNAARASYAKKSLEFSTNDARLLAFLVKEGHWSPFRHVMVTLEVKAPLEVARQWWKYVVGSDHTMDSWNETSRRYVTTETEFYIPDRFEWRSMPDNMKQGSGGPIDPFEGEVLTQLLTEYVEKGNDLYKGAIGMGVAPEVARLFLPAYGMYTYWWWTGSLQSMCWFLTQRLEEGAQSEISAYAKAVRKLLEPHFPVTFNAILGVE